MATNVSSSQPQPSFNMGNINAHLKKAEKTTIMSKGFFGFGKKEVAAIEISGGNIALSDVVAAVVKAVKKDANSASSSQLTEFSQSIVDLAATEKEVNKITQLIADKAMNLKKIPAAASHALSAEKNLNAITDRIKEMTGEEIQSGRVRISVEVDAKGSLEEKTFSLSDLCKVVRLNRTELSSKTVDSFIRAVGAKQSTPSKVAAQWKKFTGSTSEYEKLLAVHIEQKEKEEIQSSASKPIIQPKSAPSTEGYTAVSTSEEDADVGGSDSTAIGSGDEDEIDGDTGVGGSDSTATKSGDEDLLGLADWVEECNKKAAQSTDTIDLEFGPYQSEEDSPSFEDSSSVGEFNVDSENVTVTSSSGKVVIAPDFLDEVFGSSSSYVEQQKPIQKREELVSFSDIGELGSESWAQAFDVIFRSSIKKGNSSKSQLDTQNKVYTRSSEVVNAFAAYEAAKEEKAAAKKKQIARKEFNKRITGFEVTFGKLLEKKATKKRVRATFRRVMKSVCKSRCPELISVVNQIIKKKNLEKAIVNTDEAISEALQSMVAKQWELATLKNRAKKLEGTDKHAAALEDCERSKEEVSLARLVLKKRQEELTDFKKQKLKAEAAIVEAKEAKKTAKSRRLEKLRKAVESAKAQTMVRSIVNTLIDNVTNDEFRRIHHIDEVAKRIAVSRKLSYGTFASN